MDELNRQGYSKEEKKRKRIKILKRTVITLLFMSAIIIPTFLTYTYVVTKSAVDSMYKPTNAIKENKLESIKKSGLTDQTDAKLGFLIMGLDDDAERGLGSARTDSLMYLAFNGETDEINMVTIPRDVYTDIYDGYGNIVSTGKINSAFLYSEEDSAIETVQNYLQLPIDYYVTVNFLSFIKIVDAVGGITVDVPYDINSNFEKDNTGELLIPQGTQTLNGEQALIFSRIRKVDDDIKRGERQQDVMEQVIKQTLKINNVTKYKEILDSVQGNVTMNLTFDNLTTLAGSLMGGFTIKKNTFEWDAAWVGEESVVNVREDSLIAIRNDMLRTLDDRTQNSEETISE